MLRIGSDYLVNELSYAVPVLGAHLLVHLYTRQIAAMTYSVASQRSFVFVTSPALVAAP